MKGDKRRPLLIVKGYSSSALPHLLVTVGGDFLCLAACRPGGMQFLTPHPLFREDGVIFIPADCSLKIDNTPEEKLSSGVLHLDKYGDILSLAVALQTTIYW